ncbi:MAG: hypothetical protein NXI16_15050 [Alphaproteobacteria bacterium]|nr:hypothetical protein [Alphaproteobacteria bacterium]
MSNVLKETVERVAPQLSEAGQSELAAIVEEQARRIAAEEGVRRGIADVEAERVFSEQQIAVWLQSWGKDDERPPPTCD